MTLATLITGLPKAELHIHLVGSASPHTVLDLARRHPDAGVPTDGDELAAFYAFRDFRHFIDVCHAVDSLITTPDDLVTLVLGLATDAAECNVRWAEVTVTAATHLAAGISAPDLRASLEQARLAASRDLGVELGWIFDIPGERGLAAADTTVAFLREHAPDGTLAIGLAGLEQAAPRAMFRRHVAAARGLGLNAVIHAGETTGPESIWSALWDLNANRIGHGTSAVTDPELLAHLADTDVPVEVCVSSNLRTVSVPELAAHPVPTMLAAGVEVCLSTDDPGMFGTDLNREYDIVAELAGLDEAGVSALARRSFTASFAPEELRAKAVAEIDHLAGA
ncbi:aminodeoxyfutalosine deaminase [Haloactinopolyspora alba]|uniref:Aminodeoxyfutalosine deaminase n=1 Tax=Haloactinopolyspora alba TaxID=648780 RepID=A0A2P8E6U6_9ACTN|nr:adenosine deaminase [Haloactinopolyspora alba]PSL05173.1 aminodeoxyfutalosine deaminase [Haloactinopolyspora alba]